MGCGCGFGGNCCWWIIILILLFVCCGNGCGGNCGCDNFSQSPDQFQIKHGERAALLRRLWLLSSSQTGTVRRVFCGQFFSGNTVLLLYTLLDANPFPV